MFPEPFTVGWRKRFSEFDGMSDREWWEPAEEDDPLELKVFGWAPPAPDDVIRQEQTGVEDMLDVYMRESPTGHRDKLIIDGVEYLVRGGPDDYTKGPFGFRPGVRVRVSRVVG